ncbi:MAG: DUF2809 domain-containing protein [bacterium]
MMEAGQIRLYRRSILISLLVVVPLGFATKFYRGPGARWFNDSAGGILYELFWCLLASFMRPTAPVFWIAACVFGITCFLECLQLWHPVFLEVIRSAFIGRTLIGTSFTWWDFPYYAIGCVLAWAGMYFFRRFLGKKIDSAGGVDTKKL